MDFKQKYIVKCVSSLLALPEEPAELINSEKLAEFTGSKAINVLLVLFVPGKSNPRTMFRNGQSVFSTGWFPSEAQYPHGDSVQAELVDHSRDPSWLLQYLFDDSWLLEQFGTRIGSSLFAEPAG